MDPVAAVRYLGPLVVHAAAKDVRINADHASVYGVLDERFRRLSPEEDRVNLGGDEWVNEWPADSAWDFVALGRGHDVDFWTRFSMRCARSTPTWRSTSSTRTPRSVGSKGSRWRPVCCWSCRSPLEVAPDCQTTSDDWIEQRRPAPAPAELHERAGVVVGDLVVWSGTPPATSSSSSRLLLAHQPGTDPLDGRS